MSEQLDFKELAEQAQRGDKGALDRLAELASKRLRVYVYRLTLQDDLTSEIVQETLLEMCRVIGKLRQTDRFLPWLYGIATNKLRHFYRSEQTMKRATASKSDMEQTMHSRHEGLENLVGQELKEIVSNAIQGLKTNHRAVLIMRCYDGMSYAEIAESMGSTEFGTRMLFLRAKKSLQKQLARQGLGRGTLLAALVLFGRMTAPTKLAAAELSISAATIHAGTAAGLAAIVTGKAALVSLAAAGALTVGGVVHQARLVDTGPTESVAQWSLLDAGASQPGNEKHWYFLPQGEQGPLFLRAQMDQGAADPAWVVLQNARGNFLYNRSGLTINNAHWYARDGRVMRLPYDSTELHNFLDRVEGAHTDLPTVRVRRDGALISTLRTADGYETPTVVYNENVLDEDYFRSDLVSPNQGMDRRDALHRQGWTCFRVSGYVEGKQVQGQGQFPFICTALKQCKPWMRLQVGDCVLVDSDDGAWMRNGDTDTTRLYPAHSFFAGLPRPWLGLHVLDTVRRDAAEQKLWFSTDLVTEANKARVAVDTDTIRTVYTVDLDNDLLDRITLERQGKVVGELSFSYSAKPSGGSTTPLSYRSSDSREDRPGLVWLADLVRAEISR